MSDFHQAGGHQDTISTLQDGELIVKETSKRELDFYQELAPKLFLDQVFLGVYTPAFYGTLQLHGKLDTSLEGEQIITPLESSPKQNIVLENITHRFVRPTVIDIKLGTQLYDDEALPEKVQRMKKNAEGTTIALAGLRLTGCKIWNNATQTYTVIDKSYGKTIQVERLSEAMQKIFPDAATGGLEQRLLAIVLQRIFYSVREYYDLVKTVEWRLRGSSLLVVYEADPTALQEALDQPEPEYDSADEDDEESESSDEEEEHKLATATKAIDFAHAWDYSGRGPDDGYNLGLQTLLRLLQARIQELD